MKSSFYYRYGKRAFDVVASASALLAGAPLLGAIALAVRFKLGRPVLFTQQRPGLGGAPFTIFKFRTMTQERDVEGNLLPDAERLPGSVDCCVGRASTSFPSCSTSCAEI